MPYDYTPFRNYRVPSSPNVTDVAEVAAMAGDIDTDMLALNTMRRAATRRSGATVSVAGSTQNIVKNTNTVVTYASPAAGPVFDNGAGGGVGAAAYWSSGQPTRLTVPAGAGGLYMARFWISLNGWSGAGTNTQRVFMGRNGSFAAPDLWQANEFANNATYNLPQGVAVQSLVLLSAGDYMESRVYWNGTPAGPFQPFAGEFSLQQVAV